MTNISIGEKLLIARRECNLSQEALARLIGISTRTIVRIEKDSKTNLGILNKIARATRKPLSYFITEEEADSHLKEALKGSNFTPLEISAPEPPLVVWSDLYKIDKKSILNSKGENSMLRVSVDNDDNAPEISRTDILWFTHDISMQDKKYYLIKDLDNKTVILRQLRQYGEKTVLSTKNWNFENDFDPRRSEIIGRVVKHEREL